LLVRTLSPTTGRAITVGRPLLANAKFYGPLYWDLERLGGRVYALATIPMRKLRRNELRAFVLDDERARSS
jgi:hypothetical protein